VQWANFFLENYSKPPMRAEKTHEANKRCIKHLKAALEQPYAQRGDPQKAPGGESVFRCRVPGCGKRDHSGRITSHGLNSKAFKDQVAISGKGSCFREMGIRPGTCPHE
jgi:hypothetical protein